MNNLTSNYNYLSPTSFKLTIDSLKYANTEYFLTTVNLPDMSIGEVATPYRGYTGYFSGDRATFSPITASIIIDEDMKNYIEIYNWIIGNIENTEMEKSDMILSIMNSKNNVTKQIQFINAFPTNISAVQFSTQNTEVNYVTCDVTFRYDVFRPI